jgi:hypothetical protein
MRNKLIGGAFVLVIRALLVDETRGRIRRRVAASVEATIASLPQALQDEWGEEWRADLDELLVMPLTALLYARNLRAAARELVGEALVPVGAASSQVNRRGGVRTASDSVRRLRSSAPVRQTLWLVR